MLGTTIIYVIVVLFLATIVRSTIGFGEALVAVPLLALRIPVAVATPCVVAISVIVAGANLLIDWRHVEIRSATGLVLSSLIGLPIGIFVLRLVDDRIVKMLLGVMIVGISMYSLTRRSVVPSVTGRRRWLIAAGVVSGVLGGAYGMNGPPLAIYGTLRGWSPNQFRATLQGYFLVASVAGLIGYGVAGVWTADARRYLLVSLPCVLGAILVARVFNKRASDARFFRVVYGGMIVIGTVLFVQALCR
jgi:uncharacterized membrane protein YfcA